MEGPAITCCHPTQPHLSCRGSDGCFALQLDELQLCKNCFYLSNARPDNWFCYPCVCGILSFSFIENCLDQLPPLLTDANTYEIYLHHIVHVILMSMQQCFSILNSKQHLVRPCPGSLDKPESEPLLFFSF